MRRDPQGHLEKEEPSRRPTASARVLQSEWVAIPGRTGRLEWREGGGGGVGLSQCQGRNSTMGLTLVLGSKTGGKRMGGSEPNPDPPPQKGSRTGRMGGEGLIQHPRGDQGDAAKNPQVSLNALLKA